MTVRVRVYVCAALAGVALVGCGGKDEPIPPLWVGPTRQSTPAEYADTYFVLTRVDGSAPAWTAIDSGAPFPLLVSDVFGTGASSKSGEVNTLTIGDVTMWRVPAFFSFFLSSPGGLKGHPIGGIVGYSAFAPLRLSFDPKARSVGFGATPLPDGVDPVGTSLSFSVRGGGTASSGLSLISIPKSRIIISAEIEGRPVRLLFDTGASTVALAPGVFSELVSDGRPTVETELSTVGSSGAATVARVSSLTAVDQTTTSTLVISSDELNPLLEQLQREVGEPIDGMLGHSFLREFFSVIDYPNGRISLHSFSNHDYVLDDFRRVGFTLERDGSTYSVKSVFPGTAAEAQSVFVGEPVTAIDGVATSDLGPIDSELALRGIVGSTRTIEFGSTTRVLPVEDLLPSP